MSASWELFEHEADIGVRGIGATPAEAFEQAALAMTAVITDPNAVVPLERIELACENQDRELLFTQWLNALVYEMATRHLLFSRFAVTLENGKLHGVAEGEPVEVARHRPAVEVKGATLTELKVAPDARGQWVAQCVVDV